jgi:chromosome segregation ATPase
VAGTAGRPSGRTLPTAPFAAALSPTMVAAPRVTTGPGFAAPLGGTHSFRPSRIRWAGDSIGYIYVYMRGKLDAGERRRRLLEERAGAEALLASALTEVGLAVLREGVQHAEITGLLEAVGRAHARREGAAADALASEGLQRAEAARLLAQAEAMEADWTAADKVSREAEEILRDATMDRRAAETRLGKIEDERGRIEREAGNVGAGAARAAQRAHEAAGLAAEARALADQLARLDRQLLDLRGRAGTLREAAASAKAKYDAAVAAHRQATSAMAASIAGRQRDRAEAEREVSDLTIQLGRVTAEVRPPHPALTSSYLNIDRLNETLADRTAQLAALEQASARYDERKLATGVGLVTSMLIATAAALWAVLR